MGAYRGCRFRGTAEHRFPSLVGVNNFDNGAKPTPSGGTRIRASDRDKAERVAVPGGDASLLAAYEQGVR